MFTDDWWFGTLLTFPLLSDRKRLLRSYSISGVIALRYVFFFCWNCPLLLILILLHKQFPKTSLYRLSLCEQCEMSLWLHYIYFFSDPMNGRILQNVEKYEKLLVAASPPRVSGFRRPTTKYVRTRDTYERLCQTQGSQVFTTIHHSRHIPCVKIMHGKKKGEVYVTASVRNQQRKITKQLASP